MGKAIWERGAGKLRGGGAEGRTLFLQVDQTMKSSVVVEELQRTIGLEPGVRGLSKAVRKCIRRLRSPREDLVLGSWSYEWG